MKTSSDKQEPREFTAGRSTPQGIVKAIFQAGNVNLMERKNSTGNVKYDGKYNDDFFP